MEGYTLKEMIQELRSENRQALTVQIKMVKSLENIDGHLGRLNSKVASHEKEIRELSNFQTKALAVWGVIILAITTFSSRIF